MQQEKLQAFILSTLNYGESDRIVSMFTLEHGRLKAFARGARNSRKRFGASLENFARVEAEVKTGRGLHTLNQAEISNIFINIRNSLEGISAALYACELVDAMTPEGEPIPRLFRLLNAYLERLDSAEANGNQRRFFELNLLNILGYKPSLQSCPNCDAPFEIAGAAMNNRGELTCRNCSVGGRPIEASTLKCLNACLGSSSFDRVIFSNEGLNEAGELLDRSIAAHCGKKLRSLEFLKQIESDSK